MRTQLELYIDDITKSIERLYEMVSRSFMTAIKAFENLDRNLADEVQKTTQDIDELSNRIEENVFETIARRQPVAKDLRTLASLNFVSLHLYRVGHHAYKIAHIVTLCEGMEHYKELRTIPHLAQLSMQALEIAMRAVLKGDLSQIPRLEELEAETDKEMVDMFEEIAGYIKRMSDVVRMSLFYVIVGRYCERAADLAFSIAERAIYIQTGHRQKLGSAFKDMEGAGIH